MAIINMEPPILNGTSIFNNSTDLSTELPSQLKGPTTPSHYMLHPWMAEEVIGIIITAILVPLILTGNTLVIMAVIKYKRLQIPTNYFIVSLAAADIFIGLSIPFFTAIEITHQRIASIIVCFSPNRVLTMACAVSILTMVMIAYDRKTALLYPMEYITLMTCRKLFLLMGFVWTYSILISWLPIALGWYAEEFLYVNLNTTHTCSFQLIHRNTHFVSLGAVFVPSCLVILYCYSRIYVLARHHARAIAAVQTSVRQNLEIKFMMKDTKYAKTLAIVIGTFLLLWLPFQIALFLESATTIVLKNWTRNYLAYVAFLNSALNPWIYAYKNSEFRTAYKRIFKGYCQRKCWDAERRTSMVSDNSVAGGSNSTLGLSKPNSRCNSADLIHILSNQNRQDEETAKHITDHLNRTNSRILVSDILKLYLESTSDVSDDVLYNFGQCSIRSGHLGNMTGKTIYEDCERTMAYEYNNCIQLPNAVFPYEREQSSGYSSHVTSTSASQPD